MNPLTNVRNIQKLNQTELQLGTIGKKSWHDQYKDSAWIFIGGLPYDLTEGDILCVFSQYGEIVNINLVRDKQSGKSKGYGFICYEDQRSTVLAVDNLNSIKLVGRVIRVDHVENYKVPKEHEDDDDITKKLREDGCAPQIQSSSSEEEEEEYSVPVKKIKKEKDPDKKSRKKKKKEKKKRKAETSSNEDERSHDKRQPIKVKKEKYDPGYDQLVPNRDSDRNDRDHRYRNERMDYSRDRSERNGGSERDSEFRNGVNRSQNRRMDWGRDDREDVRRERQRDEYRRGDNRDERYRSELSDQHRNRHDDRNRDNYSRDRYNRNR